MSDVGQRILVSCEPLRDGDLPSDIRLGPDSCGLDFWQSAAALVWQSRFLHAEPVLISVRAGACRAELCCLLRKLPFGAVLASAYPYAALAGDPDLFWDNGGAIASALRKKGVVRLEMPFTGEYAGQFPTLRGSSLRFRGAQPLNAVRHVLDLKAAGGNTAWLESQLAPNTRWAIRKAERVGGHIRLARPDDLRVLQMIYAATMRSKRAPVNYGPERFGGMLEELQASDHARIYLGEVDGRPAGLAAVLDGSVSRHLIQLAVLPAAQGARLGDLLVATAIRDAITRGQSYFDFMASSPRDTGLIAYKAKWATHAEPIRYAVLKVNPLLDFAVDFGRWMSVQRARLAIHGRGTSPGMQGPERS